jgi:hypothetical protein
MPGASYITATPFTDVIGSQIQSTLGATIFTAFGGLALSLLHRIVQRARLQRDATHARDGRPRRSARVEIPFDSSRGISPRREWHRPVRLPRWPLEMGAPLLFKP